MFEWWIDALVEARCDFPLATAQAWRAMAKSLLGRAAASEPVATHVSFLWSLAISSDVFVRLLAALAVPSSMINRDYKTPVDTKSRDAPFFPIVDVGRDLYVIPPRGIAARALYERLYTLMRDAIDPRLETKLGNALERLTARILENAGNKPSVVAGKYSHPTKRFQRELDLAVETKNHVTFLECKRKVLTNQARAGGTADALIDLSHGFLEMFVQMTRHEIALRTKGSITFRDRTVLSLAGRETERIAITMLDHGSLQNPIFIRAVVRAILTTQFGSDDPGVKKRLEALNQVTCH